MLKSMNEGTGAMSEGTGEPDEGTALRYACKRLNAFCRLLRDLSFITIVIGTAKKNLVGVGFAGRHLYRGDLNGVNKKSRRPYASPASKVKNLTFFIFSWHLSSRHYHLY